MLTYITLTIDGCRVRVPQGASVLDAALQYGICIPHLCHMPGVEDIGVCRLCLVEVVENGRSKITTSCTLEAEQDMVILAHSPKILKLRRNVAELLVAEAPNSRAIQDIAARCGVTEVRYPFHNAACVLCGRCVRICDEVWQAGALGFVGRGKQRRVALPFDERPDYCKRCFSCIDVCPMTIAPCDGPMAEGREYLCGKCASQLMMTERLPDSCVWCDLGVGFKCARRVPG
ncbi:MAG: 2Fe-2S iron-sulfur cluster binding domain-containing protein [Chloroflexi bacterium]|nr:2Fe-2S iron-sulfur cluster binding domain-containing protein [Chloroflexota bacterium]